MVGLSQQERGHGLDLVVADAEAMVEALAKLQTLSWMQRPVVMRIWIAAALIFVRV